MKRLKHKLGKYRTLLCKAAGENRFEIIFKNCLFVKIDSNFPKKNFN